MKPVGVMVWLLLSAAVALPARARLGETEGESEKRYGPPVSGADTPLVKPLPAATNLVYALKNWHLHTAFLDGRAARIVYVKRVVPNVNPQLSPQIRDNETKAILGGESGGGAWLPQPNRSTSTIRTVRWVNTNSNIAYYTASQLSLVVETPAVAAWRSTHQPAAKPVAGRKRGGAKPK